MASLNFWEVGDFTPPVFQTRGMARGRSAGAWSVLGMLYANDDPLDFLGASEHWHVEHPQNFLPCRHAGAGRRASDDPLNVMTTAQKVIVTVNCNSKCI